MSRCFKGNQKNRNKKISKEDRRLIYTKKKSTKGYSVKTIARDDLEGYEGKRVEIVAELVFTNRKDPLAPALLENVYINGVYFDHLWVEFSLVDKKKLKYCHRRCVIHFTGEVHSYVKRNDRQIGLKYGIRKPELVKE